MISIFIGHKMKQFGPSVSVINTAGGKFFRLNI